MKNSSFFLFIVLIILFNSCYKEPINYTKEINDLKAQVLELQKRSDSISIVLKNTNNNVQNLTKSIDSIRSKLITINLDLIQLNSQLTNTNANIQLITSQIALLNQQYQSLLTSLNAILQQLSGGIPININSGLISFFPFSGNAIDSSGNLNNGIIFGATLTSDRFGVPNRAYYFDGSSYIRAKSVSFSDLSISLWYSIDPITNLYPSFGHPPTGGQLIGQGTSLSPTNYCDFSLGISKIGNSFPNYAFERGNRGLFEMYYTTSQINFSQWRSVILTVSNNFLRIYENGVLVNAYNLTSPLIRHGNILSIGSRFVENAANPPSNFFIGKIDDVRIYNRILSQDEISYLSTH
jgi:hypothetical protein